MSSAVCHSKAVQKSRFKEKATEQTLAMIRLRGFFCLFGWGFFYYLFAAISVSICKEEDTLSWGHFKVIHLDLQQDMPMFWINSFQHHIKPEVTASSIHILASCIHTVA